MVAAPTAGQRSHRLDRVAQRQRTHEAEHRPHIHARFTGRAGARSIAKGHIKGCLGGIAGRPTGLLCRPRCSDAHQRAKIGVVRGTLFAVRRVVSRIWGAGNATAHKCHTVLRECAGLVTQHVADFAEILTDGGVTGIRGRVRFRIVQLQVPVNEHRIEVLAYIEGHFQRNRNHVADKQQKAQRHYERLVPLHAPQGQVQVLSRHADGRPWRSVSTDAGHDARCRPLPHRGCAPAYPPSIGATPEIAEDPDTDRDGQLQEEDNPRKAARRAWWSRTSAHARNCGPVATQTC